MTMEIMFWGVRGSVPCPGRETVKYGGNTACVGVRFGEPRRIIVIDAGSGIRALGNDLAGCTHSGKPVEVDLFFSHTHMDHIMGFPYFNPLYSPGTQLRIYGPATFEEGSLRKVLGEQMSYHYFPVRLADLAAEMVYTELRECRLELGDGVSVTTRYLNHPLACLGYRFEHGGQVLCTAYDTEPFYNLFAREGDDPATGETVCQEGERVAARANDRLEGFFAGADLLIYDTQYTLAEYEASRKGWGHTAIEDAIETGRRARVKRLAFFHHDPDRTDAQLDELTSIYGKSGGGDGMEVFFAREGMRIRI
jgi:phosphoribosyl 1,2-cyclic phosphodiesterase